MLLLAITLQHLAFCQLYESFSFLNICPWETIGCSCFVMTVNRKLRVKSKGCTTSLLLAGFSQNIQIAITVSGALTRWLDNEEWSSLKGSGKKWRKRRSNSAYGSRNVLLSSDEPTAETKSILDETIAALLLISPNSGFMTKNMCFQKKCAVSRGGWQVWDWCEVDYQPAEYQREGWKKDQASVQTIIQTF